jgi:hypothetical protein
MRGVMPLIETSKPLTHLVNSFCEIRVPEDEVDYFEENPADLGRLVLQLWSRCAVVVAGIIYEEDDDGE